MRKLLSANFLRLRKSWLFWGVIAVSCGFALFRVYALVDDQAVYGIPVVLDDAVFTFATLIGLVAAVFTGLFLGTEYSDGAIRNKVAVGHVRQSIYLANLITTVIVSWVCLGAYLVCTIAAGAPFLGFLKSDLRMAALALAGILLMTAAFCALFTLIAMNCSHKSATAVTCILLFFALLVASTYIFSRLDADEYTTGYTLDANGSIVEMEPELNPRYLRGTQRAVYEFFSNFLPTGQAVLYASQAADHPVRMSLYALLLAAGATAGGIALFRRKDLR